MRTIISDDLHSALNSYLAATKSGGSIRKPLAEIISAMDGQAPSSISEADPAIASMAELGRWQSRPNWWRRLFLRQRDDHSLLSDNPDLAYLFIFHRNGFLRQAALDRISGPLPNAFLVTALAWRLNDWVEQVRDSALVCATKCFPETDAQSLANFFLGTVRIRTSWGRWSINEQEVLHRAISRTKVNDEIVTMLLTGKQGPLPSALSTLLRYDWIDPYLATIASTAILPGLRAIALRSLISGKAKYTDGTVWRWINKPFGIGRHQPRIVERRLSVESAPLTLIQAAISDNSAIVRRVALSGLIEHGLFDALDTAVIKRCSKDSSSSVRSRADYILKQTASDS